MIVKYSLGLDVSSKDIKACLTVIDIQQCVKVKSSTTISNTKKGFDSLYGWIKKWYIETDKPFSVCMEATGVYHENCAYYLHEKGFDVCIVLPNKAKKYLQSLGLKSKNDTIDAKGLSQMGAQQVFEVWEPVGSFYYELRVLTRQHQSIQESIVAEKSRLHAAKAAAKQIKFEIKQIEKLISFLEKQLENLVAEINRVIDSNKEMSDKFQKVYALYGISTISAATVVAETGGFLLFKNYKQLVSYAGFDVVENQSGNHNGKTKISKKGNSRIRRVLHMPSLVALRQKQSSFTNLYERVYERTGIKMKGIVAVQKKLLVMIYYIWKNDLCYDSHFVNIQKEEQVPSSRHGSQRAEKNSQTKRLAIQGKHPVSDHSMLPLGNCKSKKYVAKI